MFEKIISKSPEQEPIRAPKPGPIASSPAPVSPSELGDSSQPVAISAGQRNVLLPDVEIEGEVRFENDLVVDGKIDGKITSEGSLTIGEPAKIKAEINCGSVVVHGKVQGNITVKDRVEIRARAEVIGDIRASALVMEAGAIFVGASTIGTPSKPRTENAKPTGGSIPAPQRNVPSQKSAAKPPLKAVS